MKRKLSTILMTAILMTAAHMIIRPTFGFEPVNADARNDEPREFLTEPLDRLLASISLRDCLSPEVSQVDVAWHVDHSLKVINQIHDALADSDPEDYRFNFNPMRLVLFATGKIPRGRATAPESVRPPETILTEDLWAQLELARANLGRLDQLSKKSHFKHPVFGMLKREQARRFVEIHTNHHLEIIDDIVEQCPGVR